MRVRDAGLAVTLPASFLDEVVELVLERGKDAFDPGLNEPPAWLNGWAAAPSLGRARTPLLIAATGARRDHGGLHG